MKIINEFKEFAIKGNMFDMAIGIIIGSAFNKIVSSLVKDVIMPPLGYLIGKVNMSEFKLIIQKEKIDLNNTVINEQIAISFGIFLQAIIDFFIIAVTIFLVIRFFNKLRSKSEDPANTAVVTPKEIELLSDIKEILQNSLDKKTKKGVQDQK